jgi:hypothetical protein
VGGIFQAIIGIFFFMALFGRFFFEFKFAKKYYRSDSLKTFTFTQFLQQMLYKGLEWCNCPPDWGEVKERHELQRTVNHLLDVVYLQKRIDVLERALPIMLEEHQVKGLYLMPGRTRQEVDEMYQKHQLRDRLITYFKEQKTVEQRLKQEQSLPF